MTLRRCRSCSTLVPADAPRGRCAPCRGQYEQDRGTHTQRGYDAKHDATRADYQRRMDAGETFVCWRSDCGRPIDPSDWHLGHDDQDRSVYRGPECPACNVLHGGRAAHR